MSHDASRSTRVMLVEDDRALRQILALRLRNGGYQVTEAADAGEALAAAGPGSTFDVVVTDVHLPGISGIELARTLHRVTPTVPVVFLSGDRDSWVIREALTTNTSAAYIIKPFQLCELDDVVALVLKRARELPDTQPEPLPEFDVRVVSRDLLPPSQPTAGKATNDRKAESPFGKSAPRFRNRIRHLFGDDSG